MKLQPAPLDPDSMLFHRLVSENGLVEMGVYRVMYGYRVRAGFVGDMGSVLDWCGGGNWKDVERLYSLCKAILEQQPETKSCFNDLPPNSMIKPFYKDVDFVRVVGEKAGEFSLVSLDHAKEIEANPILQELLQRIAKFNLS